MRPEQLQPEGAYAKAVEDNVHKEMYKEHLIQQALENHVGFLHALNVNLSKPPISNYRLVQRMNQ